jgi:hypothetical protein
MNEAGTDALAWIFNGEPAENSIESGDALRNYPETLPDPIGKVLEAWQF